MPRKNASIDREAIKALVIIHGQAQAAKMSGINLNTIKAWTKRYHWRQHDALKSNHKVPQPLCNQSATSALQESLNTFQHRSTIALSKYAAEAAEQSVNVKDKLSVARKVRDVAAVHQSLWPIDKAESNILQIGILIGDDQEPARVLPTIKEIT